MAVRAHLHGLDNELVTPSSVVSITRSVVVVSTGEIVGTATLVVGTVMFNTLQTGQGWVPTADAPGFNFRDAINGATLFANGGQTHICEYHFAMVDGFQIVFKTDSFLVENIIS